MKKIHMRTISMSMDWTFGSKSMKKAEEAFNSQYNDKVYFGVGTYGASDDCKSLFIFILLIVFI